MKFLTYKCLALTAIGISAISSTIVASAQDHLSPEITSDDKTIIEKMRPYKSGTFEAGANRGKTPEGPKNILYGTERHPAMGLTEFTSINDMLLFTTTCHGRLILARNSGGKSFLNSSSNMIFTKYKFRILSGWIDSQRKNLGDDIFLFAFGGKVTENNQEYQVKYEGNDGYAVGHDYLIELDEPIKSTSNSFFGQGQRVEVRQGKIYPQTGEWYGFLTGTTLTEISNAVERVQSIRACDK